MIETQFICYPMPFLSNNRDIHTFESNKSTKQGNKYFYFIINSFIFTIRHYSSLFVTIHHYSVTILVFSLTNRSSFKRDNDVFVFGLYIFPPQRIYQYGSIEFLNFWAEPLPFVRRKTFLCERGFLWSRRTGCNSNTEFLNMDSTCHLKFLIFN